MDEMFNKFLNEMTRMNNVLAVISEKLEGLKLPMELVLPAIPKVVEAKPEQAKPEAPKKKAPAAKKEETKAEAPVVETKEEIPAATVVEASAKEFSSDDVRSAIKGVMDKKGTPAAKEIINGVGNAPNVSAIPVEKYAAVVNACLEACK